MRTFRSKLILSALLILAFLCQVAPAQEFNIFGLTNKVWKYDSTNDWYTPTGIGWTAPSFDDSSWPNGRAILSSDGNAEIVPLRGTVIRDMRVVLPGVPGSTANQAVYFRCHFNWPSNAGPNVTLRLTCRIDDGVAIYLNGVRVGGFRMGDPVSHGSFSTALTPCISTVTSNNDGTCDEVILIDGTHLVNGDNVLAVTAHSNNSTSSDVTWGCRLDGIIPFPPQIDNAAEPADRVVLQARPTTLSIVASGFPAPTYQWFKDGLEIPNATNANYVISQMTSSDAGEYYAVATNPSGTATSRTATVGYTADTVNPRVVRATGYPTLNQIAVEFDEVMDTNTALQTFGYTVTPSLNVSAVALGPYGSSVILTVDSPQTPDTVYTVTASEVYDIALNSVLPPNDTAQFRSWIPNGGCSGVLFEAFTADAANVIGSLTNRSNYPNDPFERLFINRMHSRAAFPDNSHENYGGRMRALFIPLISGNWRLYMSSDDPGEVWFNPTGSGPAGKMLVARELGCCNLYRPPGANQTSPSFPLIAGQAYYLEMIYKEGGGGDYGMVAARLDNTGVPTGGNDQGAEAGEAIDGVAAPSPFCTVGAAALPAGAAGSLSIVQDLSNVSVEANTRHTFTLGVSAPNAPYTCFQWQKSDDGGATFNNIAGATRASYTTPYLTEVDDNQDIYRVVVGIPGSELTSANALLTVTADLTRPRITRVVGISSTQIAVYYSEPMLPPTTATDAFAYEIDQGISVGTAAQNPNNILRIDLTTSSPMTLDTVYELRVSTMDTPLLDGAGNVIDPEPTRISFRAQNYTGNPDTLIVLPTNTKRTIGSLTERGMNGRMIQILRPINPPLMPITEQVLAGTVIDPATGQPYPNIAPLPTFVETDTINYGDNPAGAGTGALLPDRPFPGYTAVADNMVMEVLTYLELNSGIYRMGVHSDDDFQVTPAKGVSDPNNSIVLGFFSGGRAPPAPPFPTFDFLVPEDGLYPFRLIWNEYQGGATCEWWIQNLTDNAFIGINGSDAIKAFVPPSTAAPAITVTRGTGNITLSWMDADGAYQLQQSSSLSTPSWSDLSGATGVGGNYSITITLPSSGERYYRLSNP